MPESGISLTKRFAAAARSVLGKVLDFFIGGPTSDQDVESSLQEQADAEALTVIRSDLIPLLRKRLEETDHVFTGDLKDSLDAWVVEQGLIAVGSQEFGERLARVEIGTDPRPVDSEEEARLVFWVEDKFGLPTEAAIPRAETIAKNIREQGNTAYNVLQPLIDENVEAIIEETGNRVFLQLQQGS